MAHFPTSESLSGGSVSPEEAGSSKNRSAAGRRSSVPQLKPSKSTPFRSKTESYYSGDARGDQQLRVPVQKQFGEDEKEKEARQEEEKVPEKWRLVPGKLARKWPDQEKIPEKIPDKKQYSEKKKERPMKLSVALSRMEIEEDMFAMTGSRLSRKPKKRSKKLQDMVDHLSPAFGLHTVTPSLYNRRG